MSDLAAFARDIHSEAFWRRLSPWLHIGSSSASPPRAGPGRVESQSPPSEWPSSGYIVFPSVLDPSSAAALARAIAAIHASALHPTFVYVYDETWHVLDALRPWLTPLLGQDYEVLADAWAFFVDPSRDAGGWPVHRGWYEDVRDERGRPGLVNVWVSLTDATAGNACMHVVPLDADPHHPGDLHDLSGLEGLGAALPSPPGTVLVWNANAAHWGGRCDRSFSQPRISLTFTVRRASSAWTDFPAVRPPILFSERLDLIAEQFCTYGGSAVDVQPREMDWAAQVTAMRQVHRLPR